MKVHWLKSDSDEWLTGELLQFVTRGSDVLAAVVLPSGRVGLFDHTEIRIGEEFEK